MYVYGIHGINLDYITLEFGSEHFETIGLCGLLYLHLNVVDSMELPYL